MKSKEHGRIAALFLLPAFAFIAVFIVWPILVSIRLSFFDWNGISPTQEFIGFANWKALAGDTVFWRALGNNFIVVALSIAIQMPVAMALAVLLHRGGRRLKVFKVVYFFPMLMSTVAIGALFKAVYNVQFGAINPLVEALGFPSLAQDWLGDSRLALFSVVAVICWQFTPFYMILFLARLTGIPSELREAAAIDGATGAQLFWRIEFPMMRGIIVTAMTLSLIGSLKYFDLIWVMTEGGPSRATELMATYMYKEAFSSFRVGYGSAIATAMFMIVMTAALAAMALGRRRAAGTGPLRSKTMPQTSIHARRRLARTIGAAFALIWLGVAGLPFYFMVQSGFKKQFDLLSAPFWTLPKQWALDNYRTVLAGAYLPSLLNSVIVVSISVLLILAASSMAAFAFARVNFRLNRALFAIVVAGLVIPVHVTLIPVYLLTTRLGIYDTLLALIGPYVAFNLPISVFVLTEFMRDIPRELEEAARMDGASTFGIFWRIALPLSKPGLATVAIYNAVALWNEFVFAYVLTSSPGKRTLPLAIWDYQGQYGANIPLVMAVLSLSALPLILIYIVAQERVTGGMMAGAIKG